MPILKMVLVVSRNALSRQEAARHILSGQLNMVLRGKLKETPNVFVFDDFKLTKY